MNNFGCVLAVKCHYCYFVRLPTTNGRSLEFDCSLLIVLQCVACSNGLRLCGIARFFA